ncbi:MAG: hypothetical protein WB998_03535 [Solirubrobacteraceae bacterium]
MSDAPGWEATMQTFPTNLSPGGAGNLKISLYNAGGAPSNGPVTVTDRLPNGVTATAAGRDLFDEVVGPPWACSGIGTSVVTCTDSESIPVGLPQTIGIELSVAEGEARTETNQVTVSGGGATGPASLSGPLRISSTPSGFGFAAFDAWTTNADGTTDTQAGSHPYETTVAFDLDSAKNLETTGGEIKNVEVNTPTGLVGDPTALPQCTRQQFDAKRCSAESQIGIDVAEIEGEEDEFPLYNLVPPPGLAAQFGFTLVGIETFLDVGVRTGSDYGITVHTDDIVQRGIKENMTTLWGVPADPSHDASRSGPGCHEGCASDVAPIPLLTLPTSCVGPREYSIEASTWQNSDTASASALTHDNEGVAVGNTGCDHLGFGPSISVSPDTSFADTPAGLSVELKTPQEGLSNPEGLAASNIEDTTVTLPEGVVINPGQAAGLQACQPSEDALGTEAAPSCPNASRVGMVAIESPLVKEKLEGGVYVLPSNPPDLQLLVAASGDGVNLKLVGDVHLDSQTGRLVTTFTRTPELPFTNLKLSFSGGAQAALATPLTCGTYTTTSDFTPWTNPFVADVFPSSAFAITGGTGGTPCSAPGFSPSMIAGSTTDQAAGYTSFSLLLQRGDGQQRVASLRFKTPEGLLGMISKVPLCPEAQANTGTCSAASQIGHTVVEAGPGPYPLVVPQPGQPPAPIYLTGGYKGAPYGLSIVVPLVVGPFTLQTQVVRARIEVDPHTSRLTVTTDPLPTIIDGIPADLRTINAVIDRPGFMFNPTNCDPQAFTGTATSTEGATAPLESHFQMGSCQTLSFKPNFKVATNGKTSRKNGASLNVKLLYPSTPPGNNQASSQSNIESVKVDLPKQLPSRLTTLQKACPVATFEANPAGCPAASIVGHATAITPVLPVPIAGPAYFVSHAGEEFPQLIVVLQGYGVTIDLVGNTFINSKTNITSSTFKQIPDVPITSFELNLPQGPYSALAANQNLCKSKLVMPTAFTAQDGAAIKQSTPISVTGCAKTKAKKKGKGKHARHKTKKK